jgi:hypothetical protein
MALQRIHMLNLHPFQKTNRQTNQKLHAPKISNDGGKKSYLLYCLIRRYDNGSQQVLTQTASPHTNSQSFALDNPILLLKIQEAKF